MQDRSIIDANKQIMQERNREEKGTEERWCDMARNCSPTPQVNLFPLLLRALSSNISSTLQTPFLLQSDHKSLHQSWFLFPWMIVFFKSISHIQHWLQKHLVCTDTILRRRVQRARAPLPLMPNFPQSLTPSSAIHLTYIFIQPQSILLHIPKC